MAKWIIVAKNRSSPHSSYIGWIRRHPNIHMGKEPMSKLSLVQIHEDGPRFTILAEAVAHGVFSQPPRTKGTILFKKTIIRKTPRGAMAEAQRSKRMLAIKYDKLTGAPRARR